MLNGTLGIDTSCYTTSAAFVSGGSIIAGFRKLLEVADGERGLRQADGVYQHVKALPEIIDRVMREAGPVRIERVAVSSRPREKDDSYMPVFRVGYSTAASIASALGVPLVETSHQQGHIRAAMVDSGIGEGAFLALHLSGGTTQSVKTDRSLSITEIGGTSDLNAGQLVDRTGVYLGLHFPCGPELEKLALKGTARHLIPVSRDGLSCSFSGAENKVKQLIQNGSAPQDIAAEVYSFLARSIARLVASGCEEAGVRQVLLAGGVASSALLRSLLPERVKRINNTLRLYWGKPEYSGDNACGVALIGSEKEL